MACCGPFEETVDQQFTIESRARTGALPAKGRGTNDPPSGRGHLAIGPCWRTRARHRPIS